MKSVLALFFLSSPALAQDMIEKIHCEVIGQKNLEVTATLYGIQSSSGNLPFSANIELHKMTEENSQVIEKWKNVATVPVGFPEVVVNNSQVEFKASQQAGHASILTYNGKTHHLDCNSDDI